MKIIKHGDLRPRKFICQCCDCQFVADATEYSTITANNILLWYYIDCPECGKETTNSESWEDKYE